jgi:phosphatidate cytidylyltransferase
MLARAVLAIIGIPGLCFVGWLGGWFWYALVAAIMIVALGEYYSACYGRGWRPFAGLAYLWALILLYPALRIPDRPWSLAGPILLAATFTILIRALATNRRAYAGSMASTIFGLLYIAMPMAFLIYLRYIDLPAFTGRADVWSFTTRMGTVLLVVAPVWASDTGAFLAGGLLGRHKLTPVLSPHKTVEGAIGGLASTIAGTLLLGSLWLGLPVIHAVGLGLTIGVASQLGDLIESALKRDLGLKDFGTIFGPHGGVLDRFDGLLLALPSAYLYLWLLTHAHALVAGP